MKKIWLFLKRLFSKDSKRKLVETVIVVVNAIKKVADNPLLDLATSLTKTKVDDALLIKIRQILPKIAQELLRQQGRIIEAEYISKDELVNILILLIAEHKQSKNERTNILTGLAAHLLKELSDGSIDYYTAKAQTQALYNELKYLEFETKSMLK